MAGGVVWTHRPPSRLRLVLHQIEDSWCFYWSWRSRSLSFRGKAPVNNALALSRVWYVASLIHMPGWVEKELPRLVFSFSWSGKRELVSRSTVVQSHIFGGFSVVNVKFKVYVSSLMSLWFTSSFGVSPVTMFSRPFSFDPGVLPLFYSSLLSTWRSLNGSFSPSHNSLAFGVGSPLICTPVAGMSTRS